MATHNTIPQFAPNAKNTIAELLRRIDKLECCLKELEATVAAGGGGAGDAGDAGDAAASNAQLAELLHNPDKLRVGDDRVDLAIDATLEIDFSVLQSPEKITIVSFNGMSGNRAIASIANADVLTNIRDYGTGAALSLQSFTVSDTVIDSLFTQLPPTVLSATIDVRFCTGAATCNPSIATAKGYTVLT